MNTVAPLLAEAPGETELETVELPRTAGLFALGTLFSMTVRSLCRFRRLSVLVILFALPIGLAILVRVVNPNDFTPERSEPFYHLETLVAFYFMPHVLLPLTALLFAAGIIQDEVEDQTLTYLLIRPLPRWGLYAVKLIAAVFVAAILLAVFSALTEAAIWFGSGVMTRQEWMRRTADFVAAMLLALPAYAAVFGFLSLLFKRSLILGSAYILLFEWMLSNIPFVVREYTVMFYLRVLWMRWLSLPDRWSRNLKQTWQIDLELAPSADKAIATLATIAAVFLFLGAYLMATREFRVKTPEGT